MRPGFLTSIAKSENAAVAPTVALSLFGLIAVGGIAFDYARMASLDTELQNAADQAALAAATQLDGRDDSMTRANVAANNLLQNKTLFANDGNASNRNITISTTSPPVYYSAYNSTSDTGTVITKTDAAAQKSAKFVQVTVASRTAFFAFTPIVAMLNSGGISASATAGLGSALCRVLPMMICNPAELTGGTFPSATDEGRGVLLTGGGGGSWAPGNYGYLDMGSGATDVEIALGLNQNVASCVSSDVVVTEPGSKTSVVDAINTRFDIYDNDLNNACTPSSCSPALNTTKDLVHSRITTSPAADLKDCNVKTSGSPGNKWTLPAVQYVPGGSTPSNMGLPRDVCHASTLTGSCSGGAFGDGNWDRSLYFSVNHTATDWDAAATWAGKAKDKLTRYDVYKWEIAKTTLGERKETGGTRYAYSGPYCAGHGLGASLTQKDRRVLNVAVVNCVAGDVGGASHVKVEKWVDVFLVEPSADRGTRTSKSQIYGEIIGLSTKPNGDNAFQYYSRNQPYIVK